MAEAAFKQMIATSIRQTRPQSFRHGKPFRYPQRSLTSVIPTKTVEPSANVTSRWQAHAAPRKVDAADAKPRLDRLRRDSEPRTFSSFLTDNYSREHNYLRISVTERCNLRCLYCMPEEGVPLSPPDHILTTPEIVYLSSLFVSQGVNKIRLTGGEPTVRKDIVDLMQQIGKLRADGLKELCLTTNGISLHRKLDAMVDAGLTGVNLSLDTLDPFQFTLMTRRNGHEAVMKSINRILEMNKTGAGIKLKVNCVVMRGINEREILPFVELGRNQDLEVRFIEYMPFDGNKWSQKKMLPFQDMLDMIKEKFPDVHKVQDHVNDTSKTYKVPGFRGRIGFITSMTHNFCGTCNRLRITSDGNLKVCLFGNSEVSLRDILRQSNDNQPIDAQAMEAIKQIEMEHRRPTYSQIGNQVVSEHEIGLLEVIGAAVKRKKAKHAGMGTLENMKNRPMILIDDHVCLTKSSYSQQAPHASLYPSSHKFSTPKHVNVPLHLLSTQLSFWSDRFMPHGFNTIPSRGITTTSRVIRSVFSQSSFRRLVMPGKDTATPEDQKPEANLPLSPSAPSSSSVDVSHEPSSKSDTRRSRKRSRILMRARGSISHLTATGEAHMVDISGKAETARTATARAILLFSKKETLNILMSSNAPKGDALGVARVAAIQAAKKTSDLIPLAHPGLGLTGVKVDLRPFSGQKSDPVYTNQRHTAHKQLPKANFGGVIVLATVSCSGKTGVEMEALTSASIGALTLYDMLKAVDKTMYIGHCRVISKKGGKSGDWEWDAREQKIKTVENRLPQGQAVGSVEASVPDTTDSRGPVPITDQVHNLLSDDSAAKVIADHETNTKTPGMYQRLGVAHATLRFKGRRIDLEMEKLKLEQKKFETKQEQLRLCAFEMDHEISRRVAALSKQHSEQEYRPADEETQPGMEPHRPASSRDSADFSTDKQTEEELSVTKPDEGVVDESATSVSSPPQLSQSQILPSSRPIATSAFTPMHSNESSTSSPPPATETIESSSTTDDVSHTEMRFNRTGRDIMSGTYSGRADRQGFETRRTERYEDWARGR